MFRPHMRNRKVEQEFLSGPDLSICPSCGNSEHLWHGWNRDEVTSVICVHCGWVGGTATFFDALTLKIHLLITH